MSDSLESVAEALPLAGVRVVDLTRLLPGGYASLLLMELGAEVIKVEEVRGGDGVRTMFGSGGTEEAGAHVVLSRGKKSLAIDLKDPRGQAALRAVLATADVMLDSFRPGVLDRLGLSESEIETCNPDLVHVSITAFGVASALKEQPTHDLNAQGFAGAVGLSCDSAGDPVIPGVQLADLSSGLQAVVAVLAGLRQVDQSRQAQSQPGQRQQGQSQAAVPARSPGFRANVTMADSALSMLVLPAAIVATTNESPKPPDMFTGQLACYGTYQCSDSAWITVGGLEPKFFGQMLALLERPELAALQYDLSNQEQLRSELEQIFARESRSYWIALLGLADTCVGPVYSIAEALADPDSLVRGGVRQAQFQDGRSVTVPAAAHWLDQQSQPRNAGVAPKLGEDSIALLLAAGIPEADVELLIEAGIVRPAS